MGPGEFQISPALMLILEDYAANQPSYHPIGHLPWGSHTVQEVEVLDSALCIVLHEALGNNWKWTRKLNSIMGKREGARLKSGAPTSKWMIEAYHPPTSLADTQSSSYFVGWEGTQSEIREGSRHLKGINFEKTVFHASGTQKPDVMNEITINVGRRGK